MVQLPVRQSLLPLVNSVVSNRGLFHVLFHLATMNPDKIEHLLHPNRYPSRFGGMWTDRHDFDAQLQKRALSQTDEAVLTRWRRDGVVVFDRAIDEDQVDAFNEEMRRIEVDGHPRLRMTGLGFERGQPLDTAMLRAHQSTRIVDVYHHIQSARDMLFGPTITSFLKMVFDEAPLLTQSLSFVYGSEQNIHQDTSFVVMNSPMKLAAVWIALEDVEEDAGALIYHPGSHRWDDHMFSGRYKHWHRQRDGDAGYQEWEDWFAAEVRERQSEPQMFRAKKGDVLFWHAGLAHGGGPIGAHKPTRRSLVAHYCPRSKRPYYHVYAPRTRRIYKDGAQHWSTRHYVGQ
ncbi:MAG: phytanoyl-CoA dioxygenase family protein [Pseudomonadota bacterium]